METIGFAIPPALAVVAVIGLAVAWAITRPRRP